MTTTRSRNRVAAHQCEASCREGLKALCLGGREVEVFLLGIVPGLEGTVFEKGSHRSQEARSP